MHIRYIEYSRPTCIIHVCIGLHVYMHTNRQCRICKKRSGGGRESTEKMAFGV